MNKVLIKLYVPAIYEYFDIFAPIDVPIGELNGIIASGVEELTSRRYIVSGCEQLCLKEPTGLLNPLLSLQDYDAKNGMKLYLI